MTKFLDNVFVAVVSRGVEVDHIHECCCNSSGVVDVPEPMFVAEVAIQFMLLMSEPSRSEFN